jgi:hypothetical protein
MLWPSRRPLAIDRKKLGPGNRHGEHRRLGLQGKETRATVPSHERPRFRPPAFRKNTHCDPLGEDGLRVAQGSSIWRSPLDWKTAEATKEPPEDRVVEKLRLPHEEQRARERQFQDQRVGIGQVIRRYQQGTRQRNISGPGEPQMQQWPNDREQHLSQRYP